MTQKDSPMSVKKIERELIDFLRMQGLTPVVHHGEWVIFATSAKIRNLSQEEGCDILLEEMKGGYEHTKSISLSALAEHLAGCGVLQPAA
jgi:hypothetical protein